MEAQDILTATHKLEGSGMTRSQSEAIAETIIAALAPLATRKDLEGTRKDLEGTRKDLEATRKDLEATRTDVAEIREQMATKADLESLKELMATKTDLANIQTEIANVRTVIESAKFRLSVLFSGLIGSILVAAASNMYF